MIETKVLDIGSMVPDFEEEMLVVLFGKGAPASLEDISVIHEFVDEPKGILKEGSKFKFNDQEYTITDVGSEANNNFEELGHVSIYFKEEEEILPGAVLAEPSVFPEINVGDTITFYEN